MMDKNVLLDSNMQLASDKSLYYFADKSFIVYETRYFACVELNEVESDIVLLVNSFHNIKKVWDSIKKDYSISDNDAEAEQVFFEYINKLIDSEIIVLGDKDKRIIGEKGKCYPFSLSVELTSKCNFMCSHCYKEADAKKSIMLDSDRLISFINKIGNKIYQIEFTGGEATLHPDFSKIIESTPDNVAILLTNGSMLTELPAGVFKKLVHIQISLYGCSAEEYKAYAYADKFDAVCEGIRRLTSLSIPCTVAIILRPSNINLLPDYVELLHQLGIKSIRFGLTSNIGRNLGGEWTLTRADCQRVSEAILKLKLSFPNMLFHEFDWQHDFDAPSLPEKDSYEIICDGGTKSVVVSEQGFIRPCTMMPGDCFKSVSLEEYLSLVDNGVTVSFASGIANCVIKCQSLGRTIDSICPNGFV